MRAKVSVVKMKVSVVLDFTKYINRFHFSFPLSSSLSLSTGVPNQNLRVNLPPSIHKIFYCNVCTSPVRALIFCLYFQISLSINVEAHHF